MEMKMLEELIKLLNEHRASEIITCSSDCVCWSVESIIYEREQQLIKDCPDCDGLGSLANTMKTWVCPTCKGSRKSTV